MKVHFTSIIRTFIGMAAASRWNLALRNSFRPKQPITFLSTSALANPHNSRFYSEWRLATEEVKRKFKGSGEYNKDDSSRKNAPSSTDSEYSNNDAGKNFPSVTADCVVKDGREYNNDGDQSLRASTEIPRPRPQEMPWQEEPASTVHFIGIIGQPVEFKHTVSGEAFAFTSLGVDCTRRGDQNYQRKIMWFTLVFQNVLAEIAVRHLKEDDQVYVSGLLGFRSTAGEDDKFHIYKVTAMTLNFVTLSQYFSKRTVINKDPSLQYKNPQVESSNSGKNAQDAAIIENLWIEFFNSPHEWWDNRTNKSNRRIPDFRHKDTGDALWIEHTLNPSWVQSELAALDSRMKVSEECGRGRSSARSWGSVASSQDSGF